MFFAAEVETIAWRLIGAACVAYAAELAITDVMWICNATTSNQLPDVNNEHTHASCASWSMRSLVCTKKTWCNYEDMAWRCTEILLSQLIDSQCLLQPCQPIQTQEISYVVQDEG